MLKDLRLSQLPDFAAITPDTIAPMLDTLLAGREAVAERAKAASPSFAEALKDAAGKVGFGKKKDGGDDS